MRPMTHEPSGGTDGRGVIALSGSPADWLEQAVRDGGARLGPLQEADALVHRGGPAGLPALPDSVRWVQLSSAGIEDFLRAGLIDEKRVWTSAAGAYAEQVAEHAVALLLAGVRGLVTAAAQRDWRPSVVAAAVTGLSGSTVAVVGAGGIGRRVIDMLAPYRVSVIAVNRSGRPVPTADRTVPAAEIDGIWGDVDHVILAAPATATSRHLLDAAVLARLKPSSWVVNIARGSLVDSAALREAVTAGRIAGAGLEVTDPEPLPPEDPLWNTPGILITPHIANPGPLARGSLAERVTQNVARFLAGEELLGVIDSAAGY